MIEKIKTQRDPGMEMVNGNKTGSEIRPFALAQNLGLPPNSPPSFKVDQDRPQN